MQKITDLTKVPAIVHWMPWHNTPGHVKFNYTMRDGDVIPYDSASHDICVDQCSKMVDMGIKGVQSYFKGPDHVTTLAVIRMLEACEEAELNFSICVDHSAVDGNSNPTAEYIRNYTFIRETFFPSSSYLRINGKGVIGHFGEASGVDWNKVRAGIPTSAPTALLFNGNQFNHVQGDGCFGWVNLGATPNDINKASVSSFASAAAAAPTKIAMYPGYPGFDDSLASWGKGRFMTRGMGLTLKTTLGMVPVGALWVMLSTLNDHEEGTGLEEGVTVA